MGRISQGVENRGSLISAPLALREGPISSLLRTENSLTTDIFVVNYTGKGLVVKRPGALSKVQMLNLVLGVGVFSLLPTDLLAPKPRKIKSSSKVTFGVSPKVALK